MNPFTDDDTSLPNNTNTDGTTQSLAENQSNDTGEKDLVDVDIEPRPKPSRWSSFRSKISANVAPEEEDETEMERLAREAKNESKLGRALSVISGVGTLLRPKRSEATLAPTPIPDDYPDEESDITTQYRKTQTSTSRYNTSHMSNVELESLEKLHSNAPWWRFLIPIPVKHENPKLMTIILLYGLVCASTIWILGAEWNALQQPMAPVTVFRSLSLPYIASSFFVTCILTQVIFMFFAFSKYSKSVRFLGPPKHESRFTNVDSRMQCDSSAFWRWCLRGILACALISSPLNIILGSMVTFFWETIRYQYENIFSITVPSQRYMWLLFGTKAILGGLVQGIANSIMTAAIIGYLPHLLYTKMKKKKRSVFGSRKDKKASKPASDVLLGPKASKRLAYFFWKIIIVGGVFTSALICQASGMVAAILPQNIPQNILQSRWQPILMGIFAMVTGYLILFIGLWRRFLIANPEQSHDIESCSDTQSTMTSVFYVIKISNVKTAILLFLRNLFSVRIGFILLIFTFASMALHSLTWYLPIIVGEILRIGMKEEQLALFIAVGSACILSAVLCGITAFVVARFRKKLDMQKKQQRLDSDSVSVFSEVTMSTVEEQETGKTKKIRAYLHPTFLYFIGALGFLCIFVAAYLIPNGGNAIFFYVSLIVTAGLGVYPATIVFLVWVVGEEIVTSSEEWRTINYPYNQEQKTEARHEVYERLHIHPKMFSKSLLFHIASDVFILVSLLAGSFAIGGAMTPLLFAGSRYATEVLYESKTWNIGATHDIYNWQTTYVGVQLNQTMLEKHAPVGNRSLGILTLAGICFIAAVLMVAVNTAIESRRKKRIRIAESIRLRNEAERQWIEDLKEEIEFFDN